MFGKEISLLRQDKEVFTSSPHPTPPRPHPHLSNNVTPRTLGVTDVNYTYWSLHSFYATSVITQTLPQSHFYHFGQAPSPFQPVQ